MVTILIGDCREVLKTLPDASVNCCVTSPPYWGLRDYGIEPLIWGGTADCPHEFVEFREPIRSTAARGFCRRCGAWRGSLGMEPTPGLYVDHMVEVFRAVWRVLREDGTLWLNLGDSYVASACGVKEGGVSRSSGLHGANVSEAYRERLSAGHAHAADKTGCGLAAKNLVGIPWRVAFALQADGWYLRQDIIWAKPNPMPESVTDRCTKSHEYIFLLSKSARYYYDAEAIKEPAADPARETRCEGNNAYRGQAAIHPRGATRRHRKPAGWDIGAGAHGTIHRDGRAKETEYTETEATNRNKRSVWTVSTKSYKEAHFATFPPALIVPCILAGCPEQRCPKCGKGWERIVEKVFVPQDDVRNPEKLAKGSTKGMDASNGWGKTPRGTTATTTLDIQPACDCGESGSVHGTVLDPFGGSGTTGAVASGNGRRAVLVELNPEYAKLAQDRCGLFLESGG